MSAGAPININVRLTPEQADYFESCARIRAISPTALVRRLLSTIATDDLVLSVLDDGSKPDKHPNEKRWRR